MTSGPVPEALVERARTALTESLLGDGTTYEIAAKALEAVLVRIDCPAERCKNGRIPPNSWDHSDAHDCVLCDGSGHLWIAAP